MNVWVILLGRLPGLVQFALTLLVGASRMNGVGTVLVVEHDLPRCREALLVRDWDGK